MSGVISLASTEQLLPILKARWRRVLLTWAGIAGSVLLVSLVLPPRYEATSAVAVEMTGTDPVGGQAVFKPAGAVSTFIATQADILRSEEVALGAVRKLGLDQLPSWREKWQSSTGGQGQFEPWLAAQLLRKLDIRPSRDSNVLTVGFTWSDPEFSAAAANAVVASFMDLTLQMQVGPARRFNTFFAERAKALREQLEQARGRLSAYEKEHNIVVGLEPDLESTRLAELQSQLVNLQDAAAEAASARKQATAAPGDMREVRNDPQVAVLTGELVRQEGLLTELRSEFGEQHPAVGQARGAVADVKRRMETATRRAAEGMGASSRVIEARLAEVRNEITRQRAVVLQRKSQRDAAAGLLRDAEGAEKAYATVLTRASQTALESANTTQTSVSVLKSATPPLWSPAALARNLIVASLIGLLLGIARALLAERRDRRLRTIEDVVLRLGQPLMLMLPDGLAHRGDAARRSEQTRRRLVGTNPRLPAPEQAPQA